MWPFCRMAFGFLGAPAHFQSTIVQILGEEPGLITQVFYDDLTPHGCSVTEVWRDTLLTIKQLSKYGFMINLAKSHFLQKRFNILGFSFRSSEYQLGTKAIAKLFKSSIPHTLQQLQGLLGRLNFASKFIPKYKSLVKPIERLLSAK